MPRDRSKADDGDPIGEIEKAPVHTCPKTRFNQTTHAGLVSGVGGTREGLGNDKG